MQSLANVKNIMMSWRRLMLANCNDIIQSDVIQSDANTEWC